MMKMIILTIIIKIIHVSIRHTIQYNNTLLASKQRFFCVSDLLRTLQSIMKNSTILSLSLSLNTQRERERVLSPPFYGEENT
jgi:hypothetical protein